MDLLYNTLEYLIQGGWVMGPLILCSVVMWTLIGERIVCYHRLSRQDIPIRAAIGVLEGKESIRRFHGLRERLVGNFIQEQTGKTELDRNILYHCALRMRPLLHRQRGVRIGEGSFIGIDALIETAMPHLVEIGEDVHIGLRSVIVAHSHREADQFRASGRIEPKVRIGDHAFIGPGAIILENVTIGEGAVVIAGSVVKTSVPPMTVVQGVPAEPVAKCGVALGCKTPTKAFTASLRPIGRGRAS